MDSAFSNHERERKRSRFGQLTMFGTLLVHPRRTAASARPARASTCPRTSSPATTTACVAEEWTSRSTCRCVRLRPLHLSLPSPDPDMRPNGTLPCSVLVLFATPSRWARAVTWACSRSTSSRPSSARARPSSPSPGTSTASLTGKQHNITCSHSRPRLPHHDYAARPRILTQRLCLSVLSLRGPGWTSGASCRSTSAASGTTCRRC